MKAIVRRVSWAEVEIDAKVVGRIGLGLLVYVAEGPTDVTADAQRLAEKVAHLRVFEDETGRMSRSVQDAQGSILVVSDCTAVADVGEGHRVVPARFAGGRAKANQRVGLSRPADSSHFCGLRLRMAFGLICLVGLESSTCGLGSRQA
jgi:D-tyrosyl-tRNA(Tyr) deacylase